MDALEAIEINQRTKAEAYADRQKMIDEIESWKGSFLSGHSTEVLRKCLDKWDEIEDPSLFSYGEGGALISALPVAEAIKPVIKETLIKGQFGIIITQEDIESGGVSG